MPDPEVPIPEPGEGNGEEKPKVLRQVVLTAYDNGGFSIGTPAGAAPLHSDLTAVKGLLDYAVRWVELQWELGELGAKMEVSKRIAAEERARVVPVPGSAASAFFGGKARH